ncbi:MAG: folate-binding protein [Alphaproteobacteria bacterium]|nr:folate-binding protein [Alphaproteobacteria bacterium]
MTEPTSFLTALPDRAVIAMTGADARTFLQRVITRGPEDLSEGGVQLSALLTPQGKILCEFLVFDDGEGGLLIDAPATEADGLIKRFSLYRLRAKAEITRREDLTVAAARGDFEAELRTIAHAAVPDPRSAGLGLRAIVPAGTPEPDEAAYHAARIEAGVPEFGADYGPGEVFSTDVNHDRMGGIDYKKGCFVGQEVASRMHRKGGVRKRTVRLRFDGAAPGPSTEVLAGDTPVGAISSAAGSHALALVRVDRLAKALEAGEPIMAGGIAAHLRDDLTSLEETR